jgi:hypothetical protein
MIYRDDEEALRLRGEQLGRELRALDERIAPIESLRRERARLAAELARARAELARRAARREPVRLSKLQLARPCKEPWEGMVGDARVRHCGRCDKDVYNLTEMTQEEAETLLASRGVTPCVRFFRRADGTIKTSDCGTARRPWMIAASASAGLTALVAAVSIGGSEPRAPEAPVQVSDLLPAATLLWRALHPPVRLPVPVTEPAPAVEPRGTWNAGVPARPSSGHWVAGEPMEIEPEDVDEAPDTARRAR